ncbi:MAG: hypothetical protein DK303_000471 [Chloroflexi bacterium]|jgi:hypothetical protein|nr:MAG: hypothetical protein DK303_000471 [Chloroflexota bacterium]
MDVTNENSVDEIVSEHIRDRKNLNLEAVLKPKVLKVKSFSIKLLKL